MINFPGGYFQRLGPAVVAQLLKMQLLAAIDDPTFFGPQRRTLSTVDVYRPLMPPLVPNPEGLSPRHSSSGNGR